MFEFVEGLIEKLGVKLISDFSDKLIDFIKDVKKESIGENNDNGGYSAKIGSSGYYAQIDISGNDSVGFACGWQSIIKAKKGTWISLCEYEHNEEKGRWIPVFASSAQIGNKEYKDFQIEILDWAQEV